MDKIPFGVKAKDKITGFEGTVTGHADYITGCQQYFLVPPVDDKGSKREGEWFDEARLDIIDHHAISLAPARSEPLLQVGCDTPAPHCN